MASNFEFLKEENTLYELALFAEDLIIDGTTKLEYITAIDNMRKVLGLMLKRWVKKANLTKDDILFAAGKLRPNEHPDNNMYFQSISLCGYDFINADIEEKLHDIRTKGNESIHPEKYDNWKVFEKSKEDVYKIALELYEELYVCAYTYSVFGQKTKEVNRRRLDNKRPIYSRRDNNSDNNNNKQENKQNKSKAEKGSKPEKKPQPEVKAEPAAAPQPEVKAEPVVTPQPEVKAEPVAVSQPEVKPEPVVAVQPEPKLEPVVAPRPAATSKPAAPKKNKTPFGCDNPFNEYKIETPVVVQKNGIARCLLWTPVVCFFAILIIRSIPISMIIAAIYFVWGLININRPRQKKSNWMICVAIVMAVSSYVCTFVRFGGAWGILLLLVLLTCSLICTVDELSYKE